MNIQNITTSLKQIRLSDLAQTLEVRFQEGQANRLSHGEFLEEILLDYLNVRKKQKLQRRVVSADFRKLKTLEDFDRSFNPSIKIKEIDWPLVSSSTNR